MTEDKFKDYALILIITIVLSLAHALPLGIISLLFSAFLASVIGYSITKYHYYFVSVVCACSVAVLGLAAGNFLLAVSSLLPVVLCGISLGIAHNIKLSESKTISVMAVVYTLNLILNIKFLGVNENGQNIIEESITTSADIYNKAMITAYGELIPSAQINEVIAAVISLVMKFMPSFVIIVCVCIALLYFYIFKKALKVTKSDVSFYKNFSDWHADRGLSIIYFIVTLLSFFVPSQGYISDALANVMAVSSFVFFIFGLALFNFLLKRVMKIVALRRTVLILTTILSVFTLGLPFIILCIAGALDGCVDFREKISKKIV